MHSYLSLAAFRARIDSQSDTPDAIRRQRSALEAASRALDRFTTRRFQPYTATRYYVAVRGTHLVVDDLLSVTSLKTDANSDGVFERTWDSNDYYLLPYNAVADRQPYTAIETSGTAAANELFGAGKRTVEIAGVWGYWLDTEDTGATVSGAHNTSVTTLTVSDGEAIDVLDTLLIGSEAFYVTGKTGNTLTVVRGANGTTADSLSGSEAISVYRYPEDVVEACFLQANRIQMLRSAPFGVLGGPDVGAARIPRVLPDVQMMLDNYRPQMVVAL